MTDLATRPHGPSKAGHGGHPTFCTNGDIPSEHCGTHLGNNTLIPATAAGWQPLAGTAAYAALDVAAAYTPDGVPAVFAAATSPDGTLVELTFRITEVHRLIAALSLARAVAEGSAL